MIALVLVSSSFGLSLLVGLAATIAAAVLVAHWGAYRPQVKRLIAVSLLVFLVAYLSAPIVFAGDDDFVMMNPCKGLTTADWEYWIYSCWLP